MCLFVHFLPFAMLIHLGVGATHGITPLQQAEAKIKILTEQLISKDGVILQHAKVAEEAVSGKPY